MRTFMFTAVAMLAIVAFAAYSGAHIETDFSTVAGFEKTCSVPLNAKLLNSNQQRQAFAICSDIRLMQNIVTFATRFRKTPVSQLTNEQARKIVRDQLTHIRDELRASRLALESVTLSPGEGLRLTPSAWQVDLDGNGKIETWEKYFFTIPKRDGSPMQFNFPSELEEYYRDQYALSAVIEVDAADIAWALSYHYFIESLVETVLAYTLNRKEIDDRSIELIDPSAMQRAHRLMLSGLKMSDHTRELVNAETDNNHEWIGNPNQGSSVFPIALDRGDFQAWGELLKHVIPLMAGDTLLSAKQGVGGILGDIAKACPDGMALNVAKFYAHPPRYPVQLFSKPEWSFMCQAVDAAHPISGLAEFLSVYEQRASSEHGAGMKILKQLLWVN